MNRKKTTAFLSEGQDSSKVFEELVLEIEKNKGRNKMKKEMQLREAVQILLEYCGRYSKDSAGIATGPTRTDRELMVRAAKRAFQYIYKRNPYKHELTYIGYIQIPNSDDKDHLITLLKMKEKKI